MTRVCAIVLTLLSLRMSLIFSRLFSTWRAKESSLRRGKPDGGAVCGRRVGGSTKPPPPPLPKLLGRCDGPAVLLDSRIEAVSLKLKLDMPIFDELHWRPITDLRSHFFHPIHTSDLQGMAPMS